MWAQMDSMYASARDSKENSEILILIMNTENHVISLVA